MLQMLCFYSALGIHLVRDISYTSHNQCVYMQSFSDKETNKTSTGLLKCEWILALTLSPDWNATWRRKGLLPYAGQLSVHSGFVISPTLHWSDLSVVCRLLRLNSSRCSAAGGVRKRPRGRNSGSSEKWHGRWTRSELVNFLECRPCLLLLGRRGQPEVAL